MPHRCFHAAIGMRGASRSCFFGAERPALLRWQHHIIIDTGISGRLGVPACTHSNTHLSCHEGSLTLCLIMCAVGNGEASQTEQANSGGMYSGNNAVATGGGGTAGEEQQACWRHKET